MREETIQVDVHLDSPYGRGIEPFKLKDEEGYWDTGLLTCIADNAHFEFVRHPEFKEVEYNKIDWYKFQSVYESKDCRVILKINIDPDYRESKSGYWELSSIEVNGKVVKEEGYARYYMASAEVCCSICDIIKSLAQ